MYAIQPANSVAFAQVGHALIPDLTVLGSKVPLEAIARMANIASPARMTRKERAWRVNIFMISIVGLNLVGKLLGFSGFDDDLDLDVVVHFIVSEFVVFSERFCVAAVRP